LAKIVARTPCWPGNLRKRTIGVSPTASTMLSNTLPRPGRCVCAALVDVSMMNPPEQNRVKSGSFRSQTAPNRERLQPLRGRMLAALQKSVSS
jgi:hypothetical protein